MTKEYEAVFRVWDVSAGEKHGALLEESEIFSFSPLSDIQKHWSEFCKDCPVAMDPISERALRVSMTRNEGVGVQRRRFEYEGGKYLITIHAAEQTYRWEVPDLTSGYFVITLDPDGEPEFWEKFDTGDERVELDRRKISRLALPDA